MRVCILSEFFFPDNTGGTGTVLSDLVRTLRRVDPDLKIDVVTSRNLYRQTDAKLPAFEDWNGVNIHRLAAPHPNGLPTPLRLLANLSFCASALLKLISLGDYDVVLVGTAPPMTALAAQALERLKGIPFVYVVYDLEPDRSVTMKMLTPNHPAVRLFRRGQKSWLLSAAKVVVLGQYMGEYLSETYDLPARNVEVIPIGADPEEIVPGPKQSRFRAEQGLEGFVVLYSGNFGRYHNFDTILDAAKALRDSRPDIRFVLVGGGAQKEHIATRISQESLGNVSLFEFFPKEAYADLLASADVSLVTLEPGMEGLCVPSKLYSILASGRPVVAAVSPRSEVARVIDESQLGRHLTQGDSEQMVSVLTFLADNPAEVERMGRNARQALEDKYALDVLARKYRAVLHEAALTRKRSGGSLRGKAMPALAGAEAPTREANRDSKGASIVG